jgi:hypothetical protein
LRLDKLGDGGGKPSGAVALERRYHACDLAHLVEVAAAVERHVAAGVDDGTSASSTAGDTVALAMRAAAAS